MQKSLKQQMNFQYFRLQRRLGLPVRGLQSSICKSLDFTFSPLPKNGSSSLSRVFYLMEKGEEAPSYRSGRLYMSSKTSFLTASEYRKSSSYRFAIVRDPVQRLVSAYANRVLDFRDLDRVTTELQKAGLSTTPELNEFVQHLETYRRISGMLRHHTHPQSRFLYPDLSIYSRLYTLSEMPELEAWFQERVPGFIMPREKTTGTKIPISELSAASRQKLERFYARDYALLGHLF